MNKIIINFFASLLLFLAGTPMFAQTPSWYNSITDSGIQPGSPDFYQHQVNQIPGVSNEGFCAYFSFMGAMYYKSVMGFANLYQNDANWVSAMINNAYNIYNTPSTGSGALDFYNSLYNNYISKSGYESQLISTTITSFTGENGVYNTIKSSLLSGSSVLVNITPNGTQNQWWGFHVMNIVGFSSNSIVVLDPDNNRYGGYGYPGASIDVPASGTLVNGYGVGIPYNLSFYNNSDPMPIVSGWSDVGNPSSSLLQTYAVDPDGVITSGGYAGTKISGLWTIAQVPEPSTYALFGIGAIGMLIVMRRKKTA
jgi:hypothetical protein